MKTYAKILMCNLLAITLLATGCAAALDEAKNNGEAGPFVQGLPLSLQQKLTRNPHPQFGAGNWDILDYPQLPKGTLRLRNIRKPGEFVDLDKDLGGEIVVMAEIDVSRRISGETSSSTNIWTAREGTPPAVEAYKRLHKEYSSKGVVFAAVWRDTKKKISAEAALKKAADYAAKYELPGLFPLDGKGEGRKSVDAYYD